MKIRILSLFLLVIMSGCTVSFIGTTIDYNKIKTFSVEQFDSQAGNAPATLGQQFSEQLKAKIITNTRLQYKTDEGDLSFSGMVKEYKVTSLAPQANQTTALQRLAITVSVECKNIQDSKDDWTQNFSRFADFASDANLFDVQDQLITDIYTQMMDDVFNRAFTGW